MMDFSWSLSMMVFQSAPCNLKIRRIVFHLPDLFNYPAVNNPLFWKDVRVNSWDFFCNYDAFFKKFEQHVKCGGSFRFRKCKKKKECMLSLNCWMWAVHHMISRKNKTELKPKLLELFLFNQIVSRKKNRKNSNYVWLFFI